MTASNYSNHLMVAESKRDAKSPPKSDANLDADLAKALNNTATARLSDAEVFFCELINRGTENSAAFIKAFPDSLSVQNSNKNSVSVAASRLLKKDSIKKYLSKLCRPVRQTEGFLNVLSREHKRAKIAECVATCDDWNIVLRAIDLDNDMAGDRAPKTSVNLTGSVSIADKLLAQFAQLGEQKMIQAAREAVKDEPRQVTEVATDPKVQQ